MRPPDAFVGKDILNGQLRVLQKIGSGGMGAVYKAEVVSTRQLVAVKILHAKLTARKDIVSRFRREARAMSQLVHPNTTRVFQFGELEGGGLYIVMEFLEGRNFNQTIRTDGPFPMARALPILVQVCGALDEAHKLGIVHRDLKPENIFLCQTPRARDVPKVLDFGLAKLGEQQMRPGSLILTQEGMVFGTPEFMSPEQAQGQTLTASSDLYSLAVILYESLTGKLPCDATTAGDFIQFHVAGTPIPLNSRVQGRVFPPLLETVLARAMAKTPNERFASAGALGRALELVMHGAKELPADLFPRKRTASLRPSIADATTQRGIVPPIPSTRSPRDRVQGSSRQNIVMLVGIAALFLFLGLGLVAAALSFRK